MLPIILRSPNSHPIAMELCHETPHLFLRRSLLNHLKPLFQKRVYVLQSLYLLPFFEHKKWFFLLHRGVFIKMHAETFFH